MPADKAIDIIYSAIYSAIFWGSMVGDGINGYLEYVSWNIELRLRRARHIHRFFPDPKSRRRLPVIGNPNQNASK